ncbi:hypothetical protein CH063_10625 [Colletotrichum higginsianum]|uniref:Uncharacterized protein n=1 Tax=Colletotrichum higginsianum (strain IMI 349063) TaxID=759273 RepID=H1VI65_COLHI|nr:hypothetical protein CH063_10625 [Colletotrichum higginsianum]
MRPIEALERGVATAYQFTGMGHTISTLGGSPPPPQCYRSPYELSHPHLDLLGRSSTHPLHELDPMTVKADATAPVSAEKRQLCATYDGDAAQNRRKKARFSPPPAEPDDAASALSPLTEWLSMAMDVPDTSQASSAWEYRNSGPSIDEASNRPASWQANDVSSGTIDDWSFGQTDPGSFGIPFGQVGHENEIKVDLDSNGGVDWAGHDFSLAMDATPTMVVTPAMDFSFQPNEPKTPDVQPTLRSTATPDPAHIFPAHSGNIRELALTVQRLLDKTQAKPQQQTLLNKSSTTG